MSRRNVYKSDYILEEWKIEKIGEPGGIFCNDEAVLISDKKTDCIFEVDYAGNILKEVGGTGSGEGEFISPSAITMCNEKIYVLDQGNNRIQVLDKELDYIEEIKLKNTQSTDPNYIPEVLSVNQESIYVTGVSLENPVVDKYTDGKLKEIGSNFIGSIYSCNNQIYLINSMVRYYDEANDSFGALTSCPEWLMTIKDNKLKKLCELPDGLNISSFLLTDRGIICVSCAGAAVYRLSENGKYEEKHCRYGEDNEGYIMKYTIAKMFQILRHNRWVSILMIIEIALGMSVFTYSLNMFFSLSREKENQKNQERDLVLEISGGEGMNDIEKQAFTLKDYEKVDEITDGQTFLYVVLPQFYSYKNENYEFVMILVDYKKLDLKNGYTYWGNGLQDIMNCEMNPIPQLEKKQMPTKIAELNWKTETDEIKLKKCVVAPITYMEQYKEEISSAAIHVEWKKKYLKNEEKTIQKIETYLYNSHDQSFRYRIYSPEIELRNNTIKVMTSLQAINKVALLFMAVFLTGMIAIYQLRFEHREESYGISLAYGAQYKELYWEIFCEILLLNSIGTIIGIVIGYLVTYYVDFGIMISVVNVQGSWYTFLSAYGLCVVLSSFVSVITFRKLKKKKIIELLNVY